MSSHQISQHISPGPKLTHRVNSCDIRPVTINILPDEVLLHIFRFNALSIPNPSWWHRLVHVSHRWRSVVFASPNFLELRIICDSWTRRKNLGIWPPLPIFILCRFHHGFDPSHVHHNFDVAIVHRNRNRVCGINVQLTVSELRELALAMHEQYPALIDLGLGLTYDAHTPNNDDYGPITALPEEFLGGSAPRLQTLRLNRIPFPALPKLLSSATDLVVLHLLNVPDFSPKKIVTSLAALPKLELINLEFESPHLISDWEHPTRTFLPALTHFLFNGRSEYLDILVTGIAAPLLHAICITFTHEIEFDIPELGRLMRRTTRFQALNEAYVHFGYYDAVVKSYLPTQPLDEYSGLNIRCKDINWDPLAMSRVITSLFPSIYIVERLYVDGCQFPLTQSFESMQWLEIIRPLTAVKELYVCETFAQRIAPALQQLVGEKVTDLLPVLESLFLEGHQPSDPAQEDIGQFVAARQLLGRPIAVSHWDRSNMG